MKAIGRFLIGVLAMFAFSSVVYAGNMAGVFRLPYDPNQQWNVPGCMDIGFKLKADQVFMQLNTGLPSGIPKYHLAEDWNGKCGGSTDLDPDPII